MAILTDADKSWIDDTYDEILMERGETFSAFRLILDPVSGHSAYAETAHLTGGKMLVTPAGDTVILDEAPAGKPFEGRTKHYAVPTDLQDTDLIVLASGLTYRIVSIQDHPSHLRLLLIRYVPELSS